MSSPTVEQLAAALAPLAVDVVVPLPPMAPALLTAFSTASL